MSIAAEYLETQVLTATPYQRHLMVVDAAMRTARRGLQALQEQRWEAADMAFSRARDCVAELIGGLNGDQSKEITEPLKALFLFVYRSLVEGDLHREPLQIHAALRILEQHRQTWLELGERLPRNTAAAVPEPHTRSWLG